MVPLSYSVRNLRVRTTTTVATALGIGLVVFVFATVLMLSEGIKRTLGRAGSPDVAVVLRDGADAEMSSSLELPSAGLILNAAEVRRRPDGVAEVLAVIILDKLGTEGVSNVAVRGVAEDVLAYRTSVRLLSGRMPRPGSDECSVGASIRVRFRGLELGQSFEIKKSRRLTVVGVHADGGSSYESEVWADREVLRAAFGRENTVSSVRVRLSSAGAFSALRASLEANRQLGVDVKREDTFYEEQSQGTSQFITAIGMLVAVFFAAGAIIGAMITMHAAVASRMREIGTLRALGFSKASILASFLFESVVLSLLGGAVGAGAATLMRFARLSIVNFASWSEIVFEFTPTPGILLGSLVFAAAMGLVGGMIPAVRAARVNILDALRGGTGVPSVPAGM
jgi:putative ABC transport system permease protein